MRVNRKYFSLLYFFILITFLFSPVTVFAIDVVHHDLSVTLSPDKHSLVVKDTLTLPDSMVNKKQLEFYLHAGLLPTVSDRAVGLDVDAVDIKSSHIPLQRIRLTLPKNKSTVTVRYQGEIHHPIEQMGAEYGRSFGVSPGIISDEGVFLSGSSYWYLRSTDELHTFSLTVSLPESWSSVSQGERTSTTDSKKSVVWSIDKPQDEIYLIAAPYQEYSQASGAVEAMVFLRKADDQLAQKYLDTTAQYIEMYRKLLGPYPYSKFALVENFWETGYGMPSFTLLGPKVIRFPFILHSSYPHEILHNWWGNGVFVDYETGNWAEGLTSYLADHLIKEQRGQAINYRRNSLQKYTDFVNVNRDFPLTEFRSRHSATTEAVGYGKSLMFFHMLRQQVGDQQFVRALQTFYRKYKFKYASFEDVRHVFEKVTDTDLDAIFKQWVERTGAPELKLSNAQAKRVNAAYVLTADIEQIQAGKAYMLRLPVSVSIEGESNAFQTTVEVNSKKQKIQLELKGRPVRLDIDPEFDVFRRLNRNEIPAAFTNAFGAEQVLIVLPAEADSEHKKAYEALAAGWKQGQQGQLSIVFDNELESLPNDRAIWLFGWRNKFRSVLGNELKQYKVKLGKNSINIEKSELDRSKHAIVVTGRNPDNPENAITWLANENITAMPGLGRKLPHYGRYSYLGFEGDEPTNVAKGQWPVVNSPMSINVKHTDNRIASLSAVKRSPRAALAQLPPVFSEKNMLQDVAALSSEKMAGRGLGSNGLDEAANYIANEFNKAGLKAGGDNNSYIQSWHQDVGKPVGKIPLKNVIAVLQGTNPEWKNQSLIVSAHYDHLGFGWPDVHKGDEGKIHYGADDNASGVAVMLELARKMAKNGNPGRTIIFVAFTAEEAGRLGSIHYLENLQQYPQSGIMAMLNLDTVGRLNKNKLTVFGTGSAREWIHIFRGAGFVTGIDIQSVKNEYGSSDQRSFLNAGVPAVQFFSGTNSDFHRPTDTKDKIDSAGMVKVATVLKEAVEYLAARGEPLHVSIPGSRQSSNTTDKPEHASKGKQGRRVTLGTIPDFAFQGKGVRITGVTPGTPAEKAGLKEGDVIVSLNKNNVSDLREFASVLRSLNEGDELKITYLRNGKHKTLTTRVVAR